MKHSNKNRLRLNIVLGLCFLFSIALKSQTNNKQFFIEAKNEIETMLKGSEPLNYERAVFVTENAFYDNSLNYEEYSAFIELSANYSYELAKKLYASNQIKPKKNILISKDSAALNSYRVSVNYAIFKLITDTTFLVYEKKCFGHYPFAYSYSDPLASNNWKYSQVANLYSDKSRQGNCNALTSLFKILSLRLNSNANLCTTQGHIFIIHADENGRTYNVELASKAFPGTGSIETITHTTDEASRNGVAMRELDLKQSVGLCLINLAKGYQHKFNVNPDNFMLQCAELVLKYDSLNLNAMLLKAEVLEEMLISQKKSFEQIKKAKEFVSYQKYITNLYNTGYREMPVDMKNQIVATITKDTNYISLNKNNTYYPFTNIDKNYKRSTSLSQGLFEEVDIDKPQEKYFRTLFDVKRRTIIAFTSVEKLYKDYSFDPVAFALNIDPLFMKYPDVSPYSAFLNNPIYFIDPDGADVIGGDDFMKKNSNKAAFSIFTQSKTAEAFIKQFASSNGNLYTSPQAGAISRHNLKFSANAYGDYGNTELRVIGSDGSTTLYTPGMTIDESTRFELNIGVSLGKISAKGDAGYAAGVINHEAFTHGQGYTDLLTKWEDRANNGMTLEQFTNQLNALEAKDVPDKEHAALQKGEIKNFVSTYKEINAYFDAIINSTTATKDEVKTAETNQEGFNDSTYEDVPSLEPK